MTVAHPVRRRAASAARRAVAARRAPLAAALEAGATHVLVLQTRPYGVPRTTGSPVVDRVIQRHLRRLNPALIALWRDRVPTYERLVLDALGDDEDADAPIEAAG